MSTVLRWIKKLLLQSFRRQAFTARNVRALAARLGEIEKRLDVQSAPRLRYPHCPDSAADFEQLASCLCRQADFGSPTYAAWCERFGQTPKWHRKQWEFFYILQSLYERGRLAPGMRGVGFGVGREPLASVMATFGASSVATDMSAAAARSQGWMGSGQFATQLADLNFRGFCPPDEFTRLVTYREVDMNAIPADLGEFDFAWSSCALEHLGTLRAGLDFILNSSKHLKAGGVGVHTTEYNISSNDVTIESGHTSLYRKRDLEQLGQELSDMGCQLVPLDLDPGVGALDQYVDVPPFSGDVHLRRQLQEFSVTSVGLIVVKR
jgi:hypothetical protein